MTRPLTSADDGFAPEPGCECIACEIHREKPSSGISDTTRLDWLESHKGSAKGGWEVAPGGDGWALAVRTRGRYHSLRKAIDAAIISERSELAKSIRHDPVPDGSDDSKEPG